MIEVSELKGIKSYFALQAYGKLLLGLKMLPMYMGEDFTAFFSRLESMTEKEQETMLRQANFFVDLTYDEILNLARFAKDPNGAHYSEESLKKIEPGKIHEILVAVCLKISKIKISLTTESEKKN